MALLANKFLKFVSLLIGCTVYRYGSPCPVEWFPDNHGLFAMVSLICTGTTFLNHTIRLGIQTEFFHLPRSNVSVSIQYQWNLDFHLPFLLLRPPVVPKYCFKGALSSLEQISYAHQGCRREKGSPVLPQALGFSNGTPWVLTIKSPMR